MTVINQTLSNSNGLLGSSYNTRIGERLNSFPAATITSVQLYLAKYSGPTGTAYLRIRRVSDDSIIGTLGSIDVSTLTTTDTYYTFNTTPVVNDTVQDIRLCLEYDGGSSTSYVIVRYVSYGTYSFGVYTSYGFPSAVWTDASAGALTFQSLTYGANATVVTEPVTNLLYTTLTGNGDITDTGGETVTERGICYSHTNPTPTTADSVVSETGSFGTGTFSENLTGLTPNSVYYIRAFAITSFGTGYGAVLTVHTGPFITNTSLPDAEIGVTYNQTLSVTGGTSPYTFSITSGTLPKGLSLNANTGVIQGQPKLPSSYPTLTFKVLDSLGYNTTVTLMLKSHFPTVGPNAATSLGGSVPNEEVVFYAVGRYWLFFPYYGGGTGVWAVVSSTDGVTWSSPTAVNASGSYSTGLKGTWDGTYFHLAWADVGWPQIYYRRMKPASDGSLVMDSTQTVPTHTFETSDLVGVGGLVVDTNGYPWIAYNIGSLSIYGTYVQTSSTKDGVWNNVDSHFHSTSPSGMFVEMVALDNGALSVIERNADGPAREYYYESGSWTENYSYVSGTHVTHQLNMTVMGGNTVVAVWTDNSSYDLYMAMRDPVTHNWTQTLIQAGLDAYAWPWVIAASYCLICIWGDMSTSRIYYKAYHGMWDVDPTFWIDVSALTLVQSDWGVQRLATTGPFTGNPTGRNQFLFYYGTGTSSPYTLNVAILHGVVFPQQGFGSPLPKLKAALFLENGLGK